MTDIIHDQVRAEMDEDFVVFFIGMRINKFRRAWEWLPVFAAMPRMLRELEADPDSGLLGYRFVPGLRNFMVIQYWRSAKELQEYAFDRDRLHFPAWARFTRTVGERERSVSGTRRTSFPRTGTRPSTITCRLLAWARSASTSRRAAVNSTDSLPKTKLMSPSFRPTTSMSDGGTGKRIERDEAIRASLADRGFHG